MAAPPDPLSGDVGNLRTRSVRGAATTGFVQIALFVLSLASTAVLARLLTPNDFGLIVMAGAVSQFLLLFRDLGLGSATVQRADLTQSAVSAMFWINAALGLLIGVLLAAIAPLVATFYGQPAVRGVMLALSAGAVVVGLSVQHGALLRRQMRFGALGAIDISAQAAGLTAAVVAARLGAGYWALVLMQIVQILVSVSALWIVSGWRPSRAGWREARTMLSFGAGLTVFNVLSYLTRNLDNVLLGRATGPIALGLYAKSYSLLLLPIDRIRGPLSMVILPALSRLQGDSRRFRNCFLDAIGIISAIGMPAVVFLFVFAEPAILTVFGPRWLDSVRLFRILAPAAFVETFDTVGSWACIPLGRSGRLVRWQIVATATMVTAYFIGVHWGAVGLATAVTVSTLALRPAAIFYLLRDSPVRPRDLLAALYRPALASMLAGLAAFIFRLQLAGLGSVKLLVSAAPVFVTVYLALLFVLPGGRSHFKQLASIARELFPGSWPAAQPPRRGAEAGR